MRTRILNKMTANEVEGYLQRGGDMIFIPVGVIECHSNMPVDTEQIGPEAYAVKMAERADALVLINNPYYFAGGTIISRATVQVNVRQSMDHLMMISRSLIAQGFKKLVFVSGHGPAKTFIDGVCRDIFTETLVHAFHINLMFLHMKDRPRGPFVPDPDRIEDMSAGAYKIMGQLQYLPVDPQAKGIAWTDEMNPRMYRLQQALRTVGAQTSMLYESLEHHVPCRAFRSQEELEAAAERGIKMIEEQVNSIDFEEIKAALDGYDEYVREIVSKNPHIMAMYK